MKIAARRLVCVAILLLLGAIDCKTAELPPIVASELQKAKAEGKLLLLDAWAEWCGPCLTMDKTFANPEVAEAIKNSYRYFKLDIGTPEKMEHEDVLKHFNIQGVPHVIIFDSTGRAIDQREGVQKIDEFKQFLEKNKGAIPLEHKPDPTAEKAVVYIALPRAKNVVEIRRLETEGTFSPISEWEKTGEMSQEEWGQECKAARDPAAARNHGLLRNRLFAKRNQDEGRIVLFRDYSSEAATPGMLGYPEATVFSHGLRAAIDRRRELSRKSDTPLKFSGFIAYPTDDKEVAELFKQGGANAEDWKGVVENFFELTKSAGIELFDPPKLRQLTKEELFKQFETAENIIFIACHAEDATITVIGRGTITIKAAEIAQLKLSKRPFVFLRVCESKPGDNADFAKAFITAGARGVCVNSGTIKASVANRDVGIFLEKMKEKGSIEAALRAMDAKQQVLGVLYTLFFWKYESRA